MALNSIHRVKRDSSILFPLHLWLLPMESDAVGLSSLVRDLTRQAGATVFEPHVSIAGPLETVDDGAAAAVRQLRRHLPVELTFTRVELSDGDWQRGMYLRAEPSPHLLRLRDEAQDVLQLPARDYFAHLSLVYSTASLDQCRAISAELPLNLPLRVRFDRLELWQTPLTVDQVKAWAPLPTKPVSGPSAADSDTGSRHQAFRAEPPPAPAR